MHVQVPTVRLAALLGRGSLRVAALAAASIAAATVVVAVLEQAAQIPDASAVYLVAVVIVGSVGGTGAALGLRRPGSRSALIADPADRSP